MGEEETEVEIISTFETKVSFVGPPRPSEEAVAKVDTHCPGDQPPQDESRCLCLQAGFLRWLCHHKSCPAIPLILSPVSISTGTVYCEPPVSPDLVPGSRDMPENCPNPQEIPRNLQARLMALIWQGSNCGEWKQSRHRPSPAWAPTLPPPHSTLCTLVPFWFKSPPQLLGPGGQAVLCPLTAKEKEGHRI